MITFRSFRIPRLFLVLCICLGIVAWIGAGAGRVRPPMALPTMTELQDEPIQEAKPDQPAPTFTLNDLTGGAHSLSAYTGRPVLLYFWASWCPYCMETMPTLNALQQTYDDDVVVLSVNILEEGNKVRSALRDLNLSYPVLLDESGHVTRSYVVRAIPTLIFIDHEGVYRDVIIGTPRQGALEGKTQRLIDLFRDSSTSNSHIFTKLGITKESTKGHLPLS